MSVISLDKYKNQSNMPFYKRKWFKITAPIVVVVIVLGYFFLISPLLALKSNYDSLKGELTLVKYYKDKKNLSGIESQVPLLTNNFSKMRGEINTLGYMNYIPILNNYYSLGYNLINAGYYASEGFSDMDKGLNNVAPIFGYSTSTSKNAVTISGKEKIYAIVQSLPKLSPLFKKAYPDLVKSNKYLQNINVSYIPSSIESKYNIKELKLEFSGAIRALPTLFNSTQTLENILGNPNPQRYLLMFENSGEIRPTGGFMTAFGFVNFNDGQLGSITAQNIYNISNVIHYKPVAPKPLYVYNGTYYWHLRDANTSADVPESVSNIYKFYNSIHNAPAINGVIFINTWYVDDLINAVGGITMPSVYGNNLVLTASNANYYMEYMAEKSGLPQQERKDFISIMMHELISKVFHSTGNQVFKVLNTTISNLNNKQILLYFNNLKAEDLVNQYGWGGVIPKSNKYDYLQIVEANLAGAKDNYFMGETVNINIVKASNGRYIQSTKVTWTEPAVYDDWLVGPYLSWVRMYVPQGSILMTMTGVDGFTQNYINTTVDKSVFGNHIKVPPRLSKSDPPSKGSLTYKYELPQNINLSKLIFQKEAGIKGEWVYVNFGNIHKSQYITAATNTINL
jgi:hypothetical protein